MQFLCLYMHLFLSSHQVYTGLNGSESMDKRRVQPEVLISANLIVLRQLLPLLKQLCGRLEGGADGAEFDVGVDDGSAWGVLLDLLGDTRVGRAGTTGNTWLLWVGVGRVGGVEPEHVDGVIVPERHNKDLMVRLASDKSPEAKRLT